MFNGGLIAFIFFYVTFAQYLIYHQHENYK